MSNFKFFLRFLLNVFLICLYIFILFGLIFLFKEYLGIFLAVILIGGAAFGMTMEQLDKDDKNK